MISLCSQFVTPVFTARSTGFDTINGIYQSYNYVILPVDSAGAQALGAESLKPERSTNFSLGFTLTPTDRLSFTADAYVINLRDRITLTGTLLGPEIYQKNLPYIEAALRGGYMDAAEGLIHDRMTRRAGMADGYATARLTLIDSARAQAV